MYSFFFAGFLFFWATPSKDWRDKDDRSSQINQEQLHGIQLILNSTNNKRSKK